jgi:hypothetical protein
MKIEKISHVSVTVGVLVISAFCVIMINAPAVSAQVIERDSLVLDENLSDQQSNTYAPVQKVALTRITAPSGMQYGDSESWIQGLYYYSITKLGFADIPFNYIVTWQGDVYQVKGGGMDVAPLISAESVEEFGNVVLVAYFDNNQEATNTGKKALGDVVSELVSIYRLDKEAVISVDSLLVSGEAVLSSLALSESADQYWNGVVGEVRTGVVIDETKGEEELAGSVVDVSYPEEADAGDDMIITVKIKNEGTRPWYNTGEHAVYIATSDPRDRESSLYVSDKWASFTRVVASTEDWVLPGEEGSFAFEINTPLLSGEIEESFELLSLPDVWIEGTQFTVSFTVTAGDYDLVEILDTETGYLNVRDCPSQGCNEIGKVVPGEVYVQLDYQEAWYQIRLDDGTSGWVYGKYVKAL